MTEIVATDEALGVAQLLASLQAVGVSLWLDDSQVRYRAPKGVMTAQRLELLRTRREEIAAALASATDLATVRPDPDGRYDPFPLTDVQTAYLVGRGAGYAYGGVGCHGYGELSFTDVDPARLDKAWSTLVRRHDMLRAVVAPDGTQRVLRDPPPYAIRVEDVRDEPAERFAAAVLATRAEMDHTVYSPGAWPLFDLRLTRREDEAILHFSIDFLIADFVSIQLILEELERECRDPAAAPADPEITFRDASLAIRAVRSGPRFERDRAYWWDRLDGFPERPDLPTVPADAAPPRFRRLLYRLPATEWTQLQLRARSAGLTATGAVLAAYAEVIGRWSRHPRFALNVTVLNRPPIHPGITSIVGDFTSVELLAVETGFAAPFQQRAAAIQARLWEDLDHATCSGIDVVRELRRRNPDRQSLFPVVFTSSIGLGRERPGQPRQTTVDGAAAGAGGLGRLVHGISQTPQVWLDCQAMEGAGGLSVNWDIRAGVFPDGLVETMFEAFETLLRRLASEDGAWQAQCPVPVPAEQLARRPVPDPQWRMRPALLHERVLEQARREPDRVAVVAQDRSFTYRELVARAAAVADTLAGWCCGPSTAVAIEMDKGWEQVAAVLGTLWAGCAYVPIDTGQPLARRTRILADVGARHLLTQSWLLPDVRRDGIDTVAVDALAGGEDANRESRVDPAALAYVIYTSGSTGAPKGVMIAHQAAWNTIDDINTRFGVGADDRVLGVANLGFDLSVYDIFGPLAVGAALVLPEADRRGDPAHWAQLIRVHGVTVWNSVPSQLEMLMAYLQSEPDVALGSLRLALLSGDWIRVGLPEAVWRRLPDTSVVSLGGATEASIWSIAHPISTVDPDAPSIPYGRPLAGQTVEVLGAGLVDVPDLVPGELYIGGAGLAVGYFGDPGRTAERFIGHRHDGRRLYRTGDLGRYLPDGSIEFLGRQDAQVKIRGYRVELAEVEAALASHPAVGSAAVIASGQRPDPIRLAAFVEPAVRPRPAGDQAAGLGEVAIGAAAALRAEVDDEQMLAFARELDATGLLQMMAALRRRGLFIDAADTPTVKEVLERAQVAPRHQRLVRRWLSALEENGLVRSDPVTGAFTAVTPVGAAASEAAVEDGWRRVSALLPDAEQRTELISYFKTTAGVLPELLSGEMDPLTLLFPEGRTEIHEVAYNAMFLSRYVNRLLVSAACHLARNHSGPEPFRVLEVGSGVGGTSVELIPALAEFDVEYVFSDVSEFFLNNARARFSQYPWIDYRIYDMNGDYRAQGLAPNSYELVVCANVLHYAKNADAALGKLRELLKPGGWVLFIEATRDSYQIMTSMEFLFDEGSGDFADVRRAREQTFLTREQWLDVIAGSGADGVLAMPEQDPITDEMGMHVFAARFKADREPVRRAEIEAHLTDQLPAYMLPSRLQVVDRLPVTDNGKLDRAVLRSWLPTETAARVVGVDEPPLGELEQQITEVWQRLLRVDRVGRQQNFFELGGDSLLAAQVAAEIREKLPAAINLLYDNLLRLLLENSTVASLAVQIEVDQASAEPADGAQGRSPLVELGDNTGSAVVLVHDATGDFAGYRPLLDTLGFGTPVAGLRVSDRSAYLALDSGSLVDQVAGEYARTLVRAGYTSVALVGAHLGGIIAAELARQLTEIGVRVDRLVVLAAGSPPWPTDDEYVAEYLFYRAIGVDPEPLGFRTGDGPPGATPEWAGALAALRAQPRAERLDRAADLVRQADLAESFEVFRHGSSGNAFPLLPYAGDVTIVRPEPGRGPWPTVTEDMTAYWEDVCLGTLETVDVPGDYFTCVTEAAPLVSALLAAP